MKKFKKLIPAFCLLLVSAVLMGTSTFAWFSMNTTVTATGMQVMAKSNSTFLLIHETGSVVGGDDAAKAAFIQNAGNPTTVTLTVNDGDAAVYPCKPYNATADATKYPNVAAAGAATVENYATAGTVGNWFTANSLDPDKSTDNITGDRVLGAFDEYVIKKSVTLTIAAGADNAHELTVTGQILPKGLTKVVSGTAEASTTYYSYSAGVYTKQTVTEGVTDVSGMYKKAYAAEDPATIDLTAVKVLVVTDDNNIVTLDYTMNGAAQHLYDTSDVTLTSSTIVVVDIYIYYDGSAAAVTSNKKADLGNATIDLQFDVAIGTGV